MQSKEELIDINIEKQKKGKKNKKNLDKHSKKRKRDDDFDDMMMDEDTDMHLAKRINESMEIKEEESDYGSESEPDEDIEIDEDFDDKSEDFEEKDEIVTSKKSDQKLKVNIWDENNNKLGNDQELDFDNAAYEMLHRAKVEWPCMSIDFMLPEHFEPPLSNFYGKKNLLQSNESYPYTCYMVGGGQTNTQNGYLYYMKWYNMHKTKYDDDPDKGADSDDEEGEDPFLKFEKIQIKGNINRIKTMKNSYLAAYWSDNPCIEIVDMRQMINDLEESIETNKENIEFGKRNKGGDKHKKRKLGSKNIVLKTISRPSEGYGIEWCSLTPGVLAAGGYDKKVEIYFPTDELCSDWTVNSSSFMNSLKGHKGSIEDIIWSPVQSYVLASCSVDKSVKFWDIRSDKGNPPISIDNAHDSDVNCISWNNFCDFMIASGGEDGSFKVWDIRYISNGPISNIKWHKGAISALAWDPFEDSQIAVSSEDNRLSIWDFAVEPDDTHLFDNLNQEIPQQLIFLHQGQSNIKDLKFHPVYKNCVVSTAENGINVFKPAFEEDSDIGSDEENEMDIDN